MGSTPLGMIVNIQKFSLNDGPGIRTVVFFKGCPLRCAWCANPESQAPRPQVLWDERKCLRCNTCVRSCPTLAVKELGGRIAIDHSRCPGGACSERRICIEHCPGHALKVEGEQMSVDEVMDIVMQDEAFYEESGGGVTLSGGEATMQPDFAAALLDALRERGIHTAIETTGFASQDVFMRIASRLDHILFDIKHWDEERHREMTGVSNVPILKNMKAAIDAGADVLPRLPVIPGFNERLEGAEGIARCLRDVGAGRVQLLPFHQFGESKYNMLGREYAYTGVSALHPEDLEDYRRVFITHGIEAFF